MFANGIGEKYFVPLQTLLQFFAEIDLPRRKNHFVTAIATKVF